MIYFLGTLWLIGMFLIVLHAIGKALHKRALAQMKPLSQEELKKLGESIDPQRIKEFDMCVDMGIRIGLGVAVRKIERVRKVFEEGEAEIPEIWKIARTDPTLFPQSLKKLEDALVAMSLSENPMGGEEKTDAPL